MPATPWSVRLVRPRDERGFDYAAVDAYAHEHAWNYGPRLTLPLPPEIDVKEVTRRALQGVAAFADGFCRFHSCDISLQVVTDDEYWASLDARPAVSALLIHQSPMPAGLAEPTPAWNYARIIALPEVSPESTLRVLESFLVPHPVAEQPAAVVTWESIEFQMCSVRIPDLLSEGDEMTLMDHMGNVWAHSLQQQDDGRWVSGPVAISHSGSPLFRSDHVPLTVHLDDVHSVPRLGVRLHWSLWDEGQGRSELEAAVRRLTSTGWELDDWL